MAYDLDEKFLRGEPEKEATRAGFGNGLLTAGEQNENVVALAADLKGSVGFGKFAERFPERFVEVGIAEQNLVTVASGMAHMGKIPFAGSFAAFSPGRNYEQIRTTIAINNQPVKILGSHAGLNVGEDGVTNQMLEDVAMMRAMPNMVVISPGDAVEAAKVAIACANDSRPNYIRVMREPSPIFSTPESPFKIGKAYILREGSDVSIFSTGTMTVQALQAAAELGKSGISAEIIHCPTIKPLDNETIMNSVRKTGHVITVEEHQIAGGFGSAVAELLSQNLPTKMRIIAVDNKFGQSGAAAELLQHYGLTVGNIVEVAKELVQN